jgi:Rrf2 family nitric oxide-sensitive transcriptional repressor
MHLIYILKRARNMRLTTFSDYAFRVLIYVGSAPEGLATIGDIAAAYGISPDHLRKVVHYLGQEGYLETVRGKGGGLRLGRAPGEINVGQVLRATEEGFDLVECFQHGNLSCRIAPACVLKGALAEARDAFLAVLDRYTLADLLAPFARGAALAGRAVPVAPPARRRPATPRA